MRVIVELIMRMVLEKPHLGLYAIQCALGNFGHVVGRGTIAEVLKREGIERTRWSMFLKAHWRTIVAADFFTAEIWTLRGLITYYVFFYSRQFRRLIAETRTAVIWLPPRSPNLNAYAERFVRSRKAE